MIRPVLAEIVGSWPSALQFGADIGGAAVLPDDGAVHRLAGGAVPHHGGLALVGDADRGDILCLQAGFLQRVAADHDGRGPDVLRLVLDPARGRKMLRKFLLRGGGDRNIAAKHDGARGCGALIDGQHEGHGGCFPRGLLVGARQADWEEKVNISPSSRRTPRPIATARGFCDGCQRPVFRIESTTRYGSRRSPASGARENATSTPSSRRHRPRWSGRS